MQIIYDVASAVAYLHGRQPPIIHGDLRCLNVLIGIEFHAKGCDFGLARIHKISNPLPSIHYKEHWNTSPQNISAIHA